MKIAQFYENNDIQTGIVEDNMLIPVNFKGRVIDLIKEDSCCMPSGEPSSFEKVRFAPPVDNPSKIVAIGLNYKDHVRESKGSVPEFPLIFAKFPSSLTGHKGFITWETSLTEKVDFEAELAVIIGKRIYRCPENEIMEAIFGYTCANDVSARDLQFGDKQWVRGKSLDTFCPLGPWIVTRDEISNPHSLGIRCLLNGRIMQESNTDMMIFKIPHLISFISHCFTLFPGDVILTGTPHGVGAFRDPSVYMRDGDEVVVEIDKVGRLVNICKTV